MKLPRIQFPVLCYVIFVIAMTTIIYMNSRNVNAYWLIYGGFGYSLLALNNFFLYNSKKILLVGAVSAIACFIMGLVTHLVLVALLLFIMSFCVLYLIGYYTEYLLAGILLLSFIIVAAYDSVTLYGNLERSGFLIFSALTVAILYGIFMPNYLLWKLKITLRHTLLSLQHLFDQLFVCFLAEDFVEHNYVYERRLHVRKNQYLYLIRILKENSLKIKNTTTQEFYLSLINKLDRIFDVLEDCAQLRYRVKDHYTFQLCAKELIAITEAIDKEFQEISSAIDMNRKAETSDMLMNAISALEGNYQHVLKTSTHEPLVFLIFMTSLKALDDEFNEIQLLLPLTAK